MKFIKDYLLKYKAKSRQHFFELIRDNGMTVQYTRGGIPSGVKDTNGRSYSWQKLGIGPSDFNNLDQRYILLKMDDRLNKLEQLRDGKKTDRNLEP